MAVIKTPDQRVRVFISSTMQELADERKAASKAIEKLRLIPVLFELGARPHPPRELYRAYLDQSHIFVGIYWNNYGWVAPGMTISGLEDEYHLSENKPRLIYVKHPAPQRQPRLSEMLSKIEKSETACYRMFSNKEELKDLLENDLALLLSERFDIVKSQPSFTESRKTSTLPIIRTPILGREKEMQSLKEMFAQPEVCLISLCGTGGTGKTRLSIQLAHDIKSGFKDGVYFVPLASISEANLVATTIAHAIGLLDNGHQPIQETLVQYLQDKNALLLLDNFEQIIHAAQLVAEIMQQCPYIKILVTSRTPLHIRGEHVVPVSPLPNPDLKKIITQSELLKYPSVELFIQRAMEVNSGLIVNNENLNAIAEICRKLDGLPLAIELAASRTKFFNPVALLKRMDKLLDIVAHGPKDLPERQQTLRATIEWSYNLLDNDCRKFFYRLSVFNEGWTLEAAQSVVNAKGDIKLDVMEATERLVDLGLLRMFSHYNESEATVDPRFSMLQTIWEYASNKLEESGEANDVRKSHLQYFTQLVEDAHSYLWTVRPEPWLDQLEREFPNIRAAFHFAERIGQRLEYWKFIGNLTLFWATRGRINEASGWLEAARLVPEKSVLEKCACEIESEVCAKAFFAAGTIRQFQSEYEKSEAFLLESFKIFSHLNDLGFKARVLVILGVSGISRGDYEGAGRLSEARELGISCGDPFSIVMGSCFLWEVLHLEGNYDLAGQLFQGAEDFCEQQDFKSGAAIILGQKGGYYLALNDYENAERVLRKSLELHELTGQKTLRGWSHIELSFCLLIKNNLAESLKNLEEGMKCARETGDKSMIEFCVVGYAGFAATTGEHEKAARLLGAAETIIKTISYAPWSAERKVHEWTEVKVRTELGEESFTSELEIGKKIPLEQAIALASSLQQKDLVA